ncbi:hypothetical protein E4U43_007896 [Claviceps pusilla]|uniref:Rho coiled-coil associated kinase alpha n=1 Tax=Claviceps pusilla TaxID=123648 RepID=A0A9P7NE38_9HYPO|nr:hypothetical protein E4U43_007896 [Claviceps pusilla]
MENDAVHRYRSRILREMNANRANPFNSPPSSTGSHGTVTMSSLFSDPDGESTRRLNQDIARVTAPKKLAVNYDAAHRKWPEYFSKPKSNTNDAHMFKDGNDRDDVATSTIATTEARPWKTQLKENKPLVSNVKFTVDDSTRDIWPAASKTRAEMQARVDNESDNSSILGQSPSRPLSYYGTGRPQKQQQQQHHHQQQQQEQQNKSHHSKSQTRTPSAQPVPSRQRRSSITNALQRLQRASLSPGDGNRESPNASSAKSSLTAVPSSPVSMASPGHNTSNARSFFMPDVSHLGDFVTGTLKFSGSMKNGVPIFVKHGKVHDSQERPAAKSHAHVDAIKVPEDEEKIFVSMDMIRDEIVSLQAAHDKVQEYAEGLQLQVERLEAQLRHGKFDGGYDESEKLRLQKNRLELEVAALQARLDEASRKLSTNEIKSESVAHERDRAITRLQEACEDISKLTRKLGVREKELSTSQKRLESTEQMRHDNDTLRRDLVSLKHSRDALELDNSSLRTDNENLRKEHQRLRDEVHALRTNKTALGDDDSRAAENKSLRSANDRLTEENEELRENLDDAQHELDAAREEIESLRAKLDTIAQEKSAVQEDNASLVRHNEKYFNENKLLRRENSGFERSVHDLHEENLKIKDEVILLKQRLVNLEALPQDDVPGPVEATTDENMTSAYFVPDITVKKHESRPEDATGTEKIPALPEVTSHGYTVDQDTRQMTRRASSDGRQRSRSRTRAASKGVAFSIPEKSGARNKNSNSNSNSSNIVANQGSKRKQVTDHRSVKGPSTAELDLTTENDETTGGFQSEDFTNQDAAISLNFSLKDAQFPPFNQDVTAQSKASRRGSSSRPAQKYSVKDDVTSGPNKSAHAESESCPALSTDARRVLDDLYHHSCSNCIVCTRITSHRGVVSSSEAASGKKRVSVPRPVPATDRNLTGDDLTMRPSQAPGHALALVIKGLEDEAQHLQLELTRLQAQYNGKDKAVGRRERLHMAESIRTLLKRVEVKNDQIYSLYDVLEGQKAAGQAMTEEEVEMTVLNITGMTVRDVTGGSEQFPTWEGIQEPVLA